MCVYVCMCVCVCVCVCLCVYVCMFIRDQVGFIGVRGTGIDSDIAIDNLQIDAAMCPGGIGHTVIF